MSTKLHKIICIIIVLIIVVFIFRVAMISDNNNSDASTNVASNIKINREDTNKIDDNTENVEDINKIDDNTENVEDINKIDDNTENVEDNTNSKDTDDERSTEEINSEYPSGVDSDAAILNQYDRKSTDDTIINADIKIDKIPEIDDDIYNEIMAEASAIASINSYSSIEMKLDEYNVNTGIISYIAKFDDTVYYYIIYDKDTDTLISRDDIYNSADDVWNGVIDEQVDNEEYIEQDIEPNTLEEEYIEQDIEPNTLEEEYIEQDIEPNTLEEEYIEQDIEPNTLEEEYIEQDIEPNTLEE